MRQQSILYSLLHLLLLHLNMAFLHNRKVSINSSFSSTSCIIINTMFASFIQKRRCISPIAILKALSNLMSTVLLTRESYVSQHFGLFALAISFYSIYTKLIAYLIYLHKLIHKLVFMAIGLCTN